MANQDPLSDEEVGLEQGLSDEQVGLGQPASTGGLTPLPAGFQLPVPPEYDPQTFQKRYGGQWSGGPAYAPEQMAEAVSGFKAPITGAAALIKGLADPSSPLSLTGQLTGAGSKLTEGLFDTASELASDFLRRTGIDPSAQAGQPLAQPLPPGGGDILAQSVLAPFTKAGAPEWATGALKEGGEVLRGFTEPGQALMLPFAGESKAAQAAFLSQAALGIPTSLQEIMQARGPEETSRAVVRAAANIGMAELMRRGLTRKGAPDAEAIRRDQEVVPEGGQVPEESQGVGVQDVYRGGGKPEGVAPQEAELSSPVADYIKTVPGDDRPGGSNRGVEAGLKATSIADLDALAKLRKDLTAEAKGGDMMAGFRAQYPREAIEAATNTGGWVEGSGETPIRLGDRPLDWRKNPEVDAWLKKNAKELGITHEGAPVVAPTPKEIPVPPKPVPINVESDTAEIGKGGETGAEMARGNSPTGLPPSVSARGPGFVSELLEAARQLGTYVRSKVNLDPGVLGQYVRRRSRTAQDDKIEVGDIRNQATISHEMGHDIDALIWPKTNLAYTLKSLAERVPGTIAKELFAELKAISELMRGPMDVGSKGHQAYRKRAAELIADFFSLYVHEPEKARRLAPKFSAGFEKQLASKPDANGVIQQLLEGKVAPTPGEPVKGPTARPTATPGGVPGRPEEKPMARDLPAAAAGENLVKGLVRLYEAAKNKARIVADQWRELVPKREERNDVGAFQEGIGNIEIPGDTIENVKARMTPQMEEFAKKFRFAFEAQRNELNEYLKDSEDREYLNYLEDYLPHFYANVGTAKGKAAVSRFIKDSPNAKARKLPTLQEAADLGLVPITQDPAVLYEHYANLNWRNATNRMLMHTLKDMADSTGAPVVVPAKDAPAGWHVTNNPLVQKVYARPLGEKGIMLWKGGAGIHPDVWRAVRQMLETPVSGDFGKAFDALNGFTRANAFAFSMFHDLTLRSAAVGVMAGKNPLRGLVRLLERDPRTGELSLFKSTRGLGKELLKDEEAVSDAAMHGLKFSWSDSESYQHAARDSLEKLAAKWREVPFLGKAAKLGRDLQQMRQEGLWKNTHDAFKLVAYHDLVSKALEKVPRGTDPTQVKQQVASLLNDAFGGQEWQTKFWLSPGLRHQLSRFMLAPDWTLSTIRSIPGASDIASLMRSQAGRLSGRGPGQATFEGTAGTLGRARFWGGELAALAAGTIGIQYAIYHAFGDPNKGDKEWIWDNEMGQGRRIDVTPLLRKFPWHDQSDPTRYYVNLGKRPEEILGWITHPDQQIESKMSRPVAEIFRQVTGTEGAFKQPWKQDHETFLESLPARAKSIGTEFVPFVFSGNQFALSVPYRKGMTKFKAEQAYESVYEIQADPGHFPAARAFLRGVPNPEGTLRDMVSDISDAAGRNGVPFEPVRKRALSAVRGHHYDLYFKALQAGDQDAMQKEAEALISLGATSEMRRQSVERKRAVMAQPELANP